VARRTVADLEVVPVDEWAEPAEMVAAEVQVHTPRRKRWRWVALALAVALVGLAVLPVRAHIAVSQLRALERRWLLAGALDGSRLTPQTQLQSDAGPGDLQLRANGISALYQYERTQLDGLIKDNSHAHIVDSGVSHLRKAMQDALRLKAADMSSAAQAVQQEPERTFVALEVPTVHAIQSADGLLRVQLARWSLRPHAAPDLPPSKAADRTVAELERYLDVLTGGERLVGTDHRSLYLIDLDKSTTTQAQLPTIQSVQGGIADGLLRDGYIAFYGFDASTGEGAAYAIASDLSGTPRKLGAAFEILPSADPADMWLVRSDKTVVASKVDGTGQVVAGPYSLPAGVENAQNFYPLFMANDMLVTGTSVWDLPDHRVVRRLPSGARAFSAAGSKVAWVDVIGGAHITDVTTGADQPVQLPDRMVADGGFGSLSPDGSRLLLFVKATDDAGYQLGIASIGPSPGFAFLSGVLPDTPAVSSAWSPDGHWAFTNFSQSGNGILAISVQTGKASYVRLHNGAIDAITALPFRA
jgi:hypothetical protein